MGAIFRARKKPLQTETSSTHQNRMSWLKNQLLPLHWCKGPALASVHPDCVHRAISRHAVVPGWARGGSRPANWAGWWPGVTGACLGLARGSKAWAPGGLPGTGLAKSLGRRSFLEPQFAGADGSLCARAQTRGRGPRAAQTRGWEPLSRVPLALACVEVSPRGLGSCGPPGGGCPPREWPAQAGLGTWGSLRPRPDRGPNGWGTWRPGFRWFRHGDFRAAEVAGR